MIGSLLGGGLSSMQGLLGLTSDNLVVARVVTGGSGDIVRASETENSELFWGLRGAGQKLGIVTEVVLKIYPLHVLGRDDGKVCKAMFVYSGEALEDVVRYISQPQPKNCSLAHRKSAPGPRFPFCGVWRWKIITAPPSLPQPRVIVAVSFYGPDDAFTEYLVGYKAMKPLSTEISTIPYAQLNDGMDFWCSKGGQKIWPGSGLRSLSPEHMRTIWNSYNEFISTSPDFSLSVVLIDIGGTDAIRLKQNDWWLSHTVK